MSRWKRARRGRCPEFRTCAAVNADCILSATLFCGILSRLGKLGFKVNAGSQTGPAFFVGAAAFPKPQSFPSPCPIRVLIPIHCPTIACLGASDAARAWGCNHLCRADACVDPVRGSARAHASGDGMTPQRERRPQRPRQGTSPAGGLLRSRKRSRGNDDKVRT